MAATKKTPPAGAKPAAKEAAKKPAPTKPEAAKADPPVQPVTDPAAATPVVDPAQAAAEERKAQQLGELGLSAASQQPADEQPAPAAAPVVEGALPTKVVLTHPYGYFLDDAEGQPMRAWPAGAVVEDPDEIADLIARKAPIECPASE